MKKARKQEKQIEVEVVRKGVAHSPLRRIVPRRTVRVSMNAGSIIDALAENCRVEFVDASGNAWMQIQTMCNIDGELVAVPQVYKTFTEACYCDATPRFVRSGQGKQTVPIDSKRYFELRKEARNNRAKVVPRRLVTCPRCGYEFELTGFSAN